MLAAIKDIKDNKETLEGESLEDVDQLLEQVIECQQVVLKVLECPSNSKLVEILLEATGQIYELQSLFIKN